MRRDWKQGPPTEVGWYVVTGDPTGRDAGEWRSYWNGAGWFGFVHRDAFFTRAVRGYPVGDDNPLHYAERLQPQPEKPL